MNFEVLMDPRENPRKCTVQPLKGRPGLLIRKFGEKEKIPALTADLLLHIDGEELPELARKTKVASVAVIDCIWKRVPVALKRLEGPLPRLARIPNGFVTAYPRKNKLGQDPLEGLATIEAMFISAAFFGDWDETLLDHYHFKNEFLAQNASAWKQYGLGPHAG